MSHKVTHGSNVVLGGWASDHPGSQLPREAGADESRASIRADHDPLRRDVPVGQRRLVQHRERLAQREGHREHVTRAKRRLSTHAIEVEPVGGHSMGEGDTSGDV